MSNTSESLQNRSLFQVGERADELLKATFKKVGFTQYDVLYMPIMCYKFRGYQIFATATAAQCLR